MGKVIVLLPFYMEMYLTGRDISFQGFLGESESELTDCLPPLRGH